MACKDCEAQGTKLTRPAPHPGPRCTTHHRLRKKQVKVRSHEARVIKLYGLRAGEYQALYEAQGGRCYICRKATGKARRLAVDHDHGCCPETPTCGKCTRGLCCYPCNHDLLGKYDEEALARAILYLRNPPAPGVLAKLRGEL